jgi:hypothetical protein
MIVEYICDRIPDDEARSVARIDRPEESIAPAHRPLRTLPGTLESAEEPG